MKNKKKISIEQEQRIREVQRQFPQDYHKKLEPELGIKSKSIKLHFDNYLRPGLEQNFTEEEDKYLISLVERLKNEKVNRPFMYIARIWSNRSPEILKGRWHTLMRRIEHRQTLPDGSRCGFPDIRRAKNRKECVKNDEVTREEHGSKEETVFQTWLENNDVDVNFDLEQCDFDIIFD